MKKQSLSESSVCSEVSDVQSELNDKLLVEYEYDKYVSGITGYTGMNLQQISFCQEAPAVRTRIGGRGNYKGGLCQCGDGSLLVAVCRQVETIFHIFIYQSDDQGLNWRDLHAKELYGKEPCLTCLPDGTLVLTAQAIGTPTVSGTQIAVYRSDNKGENWESNPIEGFDYPRNLIVEEDGTLLMVRSQMPLWGRHYYEESGKPFTPSSDLELLRSKDGGRHWSRQIGKVDWSHQNLSEVSVIRLRDGRLLAALRGNPPESEGEGFEVTWLTESSDDGQTWDSPHQMSRTAEVHVYLTELSDGRLLATYSNYHLPFGVYAVVSEDQGKTWGHDHSIQLALSADLYVGWPVTLELSPGDLITVYASTTYMHQPPDRFTCEAVRWRLPY